MEEKMILDDKNEQNLNMAGFRYSIIAELTNPNLSKAEIKRMVRQKAARSYSIPGSSKTKITAKSIMKWLRDFESSGFTGITPKIRMDRGKSRSLTQEEQDAFLSYLEKYPELTAKSAFLNLRKKGVIKNDISKSGLSRLVTSNGLDKKNRMSLSDRNPNEKCLKFNFEYPLECVQADVMHAIDVPDGKGKMKKAKLLSFIDDSTRRILYSNFSFTEKSEDFEKGIKYILSNHGKIHRIYVDNGAAFISKQTKKILNILGIPITHSRPYKPRGRGKKERFYRTAREQCLRPLVDQKIESIEQLNVLFKTWLECEYHRNPHSGLNGQTPLDAWLSKTKYIVPISPTIDIDQVFFHQHKRKIYNDSTFSFQGTLYEAPSTLIGKTITVKYDPHSHIKKLLIYLDGQYICEPKVVDTYANTKVSRNFNAKSQIITNNEVSDPDDKQINRSLSAAEIDI
jgi:putative transposase